MPRTTMLLWSGMAVVSLETLWGEALTRGKLGHAYVLLGEGTRAVALEFLRRLLCESGKGCRTCSPCMKVAHGAHPDIRWVEPSGTRISIDQIRELQRDARYRPLQAPRKAYVLVNSEDLSLEGANSLLRILESPPAYVLFLLLARSLQLPPTILSRCQIIRIKPLARQQVRDLLAERRLNRDETAYLMAVVEGSPPRLARLLHGGEPISKPLERRERMLARAANLTDQELVRELERAEGPIEEREGSLALLQRLRAKKPHELLELAHDVGKLPRPMLEMFFGEALRWYRDLALLGIDGGEALVFSRDRMDQLRAEHATLTGEHVHRVIRLLEELWQAFRGNANVQLMVESSLLTLASE